MGVRLPTRELALGRACLAGVLSKLLGPARLTHSWPLDSRDQASLGFFFFFFLFNIYLFILAAPGLSSGPWDLP